MSKELTHPILIKSTVFPTIEIERVASQMLEWMESESPGGYITGNPRIGKSRCIQFLHRHTKAIFKSDIPTCIFRVGDPDEGTTSNKTFYTELLWSLGHRIYDSGNTVMRGKRAIIYMRDLCLKHDEDRFIIYFDEAQWLDDKQLCCLLNIQNQLEGFGIELVAILVGTPTLAEKRDHLIASGQSNVADRFFVNETTFNGICDLETLRSFFYYIDNKTEWPAGSRNNYVSHFLPLAVDSGWNISHEADRLWFLIEGIVKSEGLQNIEELPFQPIMALTRGILRKASDLDVADLKLEDKFYTDLIRKLCLKQIIGHVKESSFRKPVRKRRTRR